MKKIILLELLLILCSHQAKSQTISFAGIALEGIGHSIEITDLPDTATSVQVSIKGDEFFSIFSLTVKSGKADTTIIINNTGRYELQAGGSKGPNTSFRVIPGLFSIIPPLLAIVLALVFRQVILSLVFGIYIGVLFMYDNNPLIALLRLIDTEIIKALNDESHIQILVFTFLFGGIVGLISRSGGTRGIANLVSKIAKTRRSSLFATWLSGIIIFFDDYANTLIVGNLMRPITDKMKISREKLAFIVDATAAPVASIFIVSSWIGYEIGLIQDALAIIGSSENAYDIFLQTIPYRFYPIAMLVFVLIITLSQRDFGSMYKAERRAVDENKVSRDGAKLTADLSETSGIFANEDKARWYNGIVPIALFVIITVVGLIYTGITSLEEKGITNYTIREIIGNSNSYLALLWASMSACTIAAIMILAQRIMNLSDTIDAWFMGVRSMLFALIILTLAWSIGSITKELRTADFIISMISDSINPRFLPVLVFLACALISFATGTSWGTMAIMMPIAIPLGHSVAVLFNYNAADATIILHGVISSVLTGSVFGDHCSPIADTTILSSMASGCDHMDHVRTQLPYAVLTGVLCMLLGDIPTAFGVSPYLSLLLISGILAVVLFTVGKKVNTT